MGSVVQLSMGLNTYRPWTLRACTCGCVKDERGVKGCQTRAKRRFALCELCHHLASHQRITGIDSTGLAHPNYKCGCFSLDSPWVNSPCSLVLSGTYSVRRGGFQCYMAWSLALFCIAAFFRTIHEWRNGFELSAFTKVAQCHRFPLSGMHGGPRFFVRDKI